MTLDEAEKLAINAVARQLAKPVELCVSRPYTIEKHYGWVFFINSCEHLQTKDIGLLLIGVGPTIVTKTTGTVYRLPSGIPLSEALEEFERQLPPTY